MTAANHLVCLTDIHGQWRSYRSILSHIKQDSLLLLGGDLTNFGSPSDTEELIKEAQRRAACVYAVAGNCDSPEIDRSLVEADVSLFGIGRFWRSIALLGLSAMPPWRGKMYELTEEQLDAHLKKGLAQLVDLHQSRSDRLASASSLVVLSHVPPLDCEVDRNHRGTHIGSRALREFVEQQKPEVVVCGHVHEARGICRVDDTVVINCGPAYLGHFAELTFSQSAGEGKSGSPDDSLDIEFDQTSCLLVRSPEPRFAPKESEGMSSAPQILQIEAKLRTATPR